jgi:predicted nuclease of predicted toxin-antitoxin system
MKIYFLDDNNLQELNAHFKSLYITTVNKFEEQLEIYKKKVDKNKYKVLINELEETLIILKDSDFEDFFSTMGLETLEKIRYASVSKHTDQCIIRAVFDILFKYCLDFEYKVSHLCCTNRMFKTLQIEILRDLRWKISSFNPIPIQSPIRNLKI